MFFIATNLFVQNQYKKKPDPENKDC